MIVVHHLNNSRSQRVLWLLEELGIPHDIKRYQRDARTMLAPPELMKVHPMGKSPVITDGTRTIAESGAIIDYVIERHADGRLAPIRMLRCQFCGGVSGTRRTRTAIAPFMLRAAVGMFPSSSA